MALDITRQGYARKRILKPAGYALGLALTLTDKPLPRSALTVRRALAIKDFMARHGIVFKKIPRDITRF